MFLELTVHFVIYGNDCLLPVFLAVVSAVVIPHDLSLLAESVYLEDRHVVKFLHILLDLQFAEVVARSEADGLVVVGLG
jgi:hypothetical protein